jgi:hypothetical protein
MSLPKGRSGYTVGYISHYVSHDVPIISPLYVHYLSINTYIYIYVCIYISNKILISNECLSSWQVLFSVFGNNLSGWVEQGRRNPERFANDGFFRRISTASSMWCPILAVVAKVLYK